MLLQVTVVHSYTLLCSITQYGYNTIYSSVLLMDISPPMKIYMSLGVGIQDVFPDIYCRLEFLVFLHI